eukprot:4270484-Alexandrium_andersonii.AAC.1
MLMRAPEQNAADNVPQDPNEEIQATNFGPSQDDSTPTEEQLLGEKILDVIRAVPTEGQDRG